MTRRIAVLAAALMSACGSGGTLTGTVTVQGGSAANVAVFIYGATSTAAVTGADGRFSARGLPDGDYSVLARVRGADVEELSAPVRLTGGKPEAEPTLAFTLSSGTVTGRLVLADASSAANVTITLTGATSRATRTTGDGAFTFSKVPAGAYVVSADLLDTREGRASLGVVVSGGAQDVGELRLTPVGRLGGVVTLNGAPAAGAVVAIAGSPLSALSDAQGRFSFPEVPTGDVTVVATAGAQQQLSATASAPVTRGGTADVTLALADAQARRGTVRGAVTFTSAQSPTLITVSVPGTGATAMADANGAFSLMVPEGEWDVVARAPFHPPQVLGRARVVAGQTTRLEGAELSWFRPIFETAAALTNVTTLGQSATTPWLVFRTTDGVVQRSYLFNSDSLELRLLANTSVTSVRFSANAKYVGFLLNGELMVHQLSTGAITTWGTSVTSFEFSSSEAVLFIVRGGALERINLTTTAVTRFPAMGAATQLLQHTNDRWLVRESSNDVTLVEPTAATAQVFTAVQTMQVFPTPWALTSCAASCTLKVLPATAQAAVTVTRGFPATTSVQLSPADYPSYLADSKYVITRASDGSFTELPAGTNRLQFSPDGRRYAFQTTSMSTTTIREEALPPTASPTMVAQSTASMTTAYLSNSRFVALEQVAPRRIFDGKASGAAPLSTTIDNDVDATVAAGLAAPLLIWPKLSTGKWNVIIGDKAPLALPIDFTVPPIASAIRPLGADGPTDYAAVGFDPINTWVLDARLGQVRKLPGGAPVAADRSRSTELFIWQRPGGPDFVTFGPEVVLSLTDPQVASGNGAQANGERGVLAVSQDRHHVLFGVVRP